MQKQCGNQSELRGIQREGNGENPWQPVRQPLPSSPGGPGRALPLQSIQDIPIGDN